LPKRKNPKFALDIFPSLVILYSYKEAAHHLKMGCSTLYRLANEGRIPAHRTGREWRFDAEELDEWMKSGKRASQEDEKA